MKRQDYYPSTVPEQVRWLDNFGRELPRHATALGLTAAELEEAVADARWLTYLLGSWRVGARNWSRSLSSMLEHAQMGRGAEPPHALAYIPPALPEGVVPRPAGGLQRLFRLVQRLKTHAGCTREARIALDLNTRPDYRQHTSTKLKLSLTRSGVGPQIVEVRGRRWGHYGLLIQSRRGGGEWQEVGVLATRVFQDTRPLAVHGQPEVREYRARFWDGTEEISGNWSPVYTITVAP